MMKSLIDALMIPLVIFVCVAIYLMARWVLRPLDEAARGLRRPTQFTIADLLCLAVLLQVVTALLLGFFRAPTEKTRPLMWLLGVFAWLATVAFWAKCVQVMSRAGIHRPWHRAALLLFVWPATITSTIAVLILSGATLVNLNLKEMLHAGMCALGAVVAIGALFVSAQLTRRMVAEAEPGLAEAVDTTAGLSSSAKQIREDGTAGQASSGTLPSAETPPTSPSESS